MSIKSLFSPSHYCNFAMMKHLFILLLSGYLFISLAACKQHRPYDDQLAHIDSLADVNPDSADVLLLSTPNSSQKGGEREVALLLHIKVDDKLYRPITHYRDTILQLVDYFEQHPRVLPRLLGKTGPALPYLYAGRVFADLGDAPQALDYYQRTLDVMPDVQIENGEWKVDNEEARRLAKQRGLLHSFIGTQFYYQDLFENALKSYKQADLWARLVSDTLGMILNNRDIAEQFKYLNQNDSSLFYYQKAHYYAYAINDQKRIAEISSQIGSLYKQKGMYSQARAYMQPAIDHFDSLNISSTYSILAELHIKTNQLDSAKFYLSELLSHGNLYGKRYAYKELSKMAMNSGSIHEAWSYLKLFEMTDDSIRARDNAETVARMHALYNYEQHKQLAAKLKVEKAKVESTNLRLLIIVLLLIITMIALFLFYRNSQKEVRMQQKSSETRKKYESKLAENNSLVQDLAQNQKSHEILEDEYENLKKEREELSHLLKKQELFIEQDIESLRKVMESTIYKTLVNISSGKNNRFVTKEEWNLLSDTINTFFPSFEINIYSLFSPSERQYRLCMLRKLKFQTAAIVKLVGYQEATVYSNYKRLYEKATGQKGTSADFERLLKSL